LTEIAQMRAKMELIERMQRFETEEVRDAGQRWLDLLQEKIENLEPGSTRAKAAG
jgi:hypothetical protein